MTPTAASTIPHPAAACEAAESAPRVSVVMPVRNEAEHIDACLGAVLSQRDVPGGFEVLVVDGRSEDDTRERVRAQSEAAPCAVRLLDNPDLSAAAALNAGIAAARGDVIVRVDGHAVVGEAYLSSLLAALDRTGADVVGGRVEPRGRRSIADALRHPFGNGGAAYRVGGAERDVDTVACGAYRRDALERIGGFDATLERNQDDDAHLRLRRAGSRIVFVPDVVVGYACRSTFTALARQFFAYGDWKAVDAVRLGRPTSMRALAPTALVLALLAGGAFALVSGEAWTAAAVPIAYAALVILGALTIGPLPVSAAWRRLAIVPPLVVMHVAYGLGVLRGAMRWGRSA